MADNLRNEVQIELAGETRTMRATFAAIRGIEADTGRSIIATINRLRRPRRPVRDRQRHHHLPWPARVR
jgi:hypothetical protein